MATVIKAATFCLLLLALPTYANTKADSSNSIEDQNFPPNPPQLRMFRLPDFSTVATGRSP